MKWHLYQFESQLYLAGNIKNVCEHVAKYHHRENYHVVQMPDNTMVKTDDGIFSLAQLIIRMKAYARKNGYKVTADLSILVRNGKVITYLEQGDEIMG